jgi:hypothetical protein
MGLILNPPAAGGSTIPDRFIRQLVSHLSHKVTTEWQSEGGAMIAVK